MSAPSRRSSSPTPAFASGDTLLPVLKGVGPAIVRKLAERGLTTLQDLWLHLPLRYEDRTQLTTIRALRAGEAAQVEGVVEAVERGFRYRPMLRVAIGDDSQSTLVLRFFHFRAAQVAQFAVGARVRAYGTPRAGSYGLEIVHPSYRVLGATDASTLRERLDPVYPAIEGVGAAQLARLIDAALQRLPEADALELLPPDSLASLNLPTLREALLTAHRPPADADLALREFRAVAHAAVDHHAGPAVFRGRCAEIAAQQRTAQRAATIDHQHPAAAR